VAHSGTVKAVWGAVQLRQSSGWCSEVKVRCSFAEVLFSSGLAGFGQGEVQRCPEQ
jgi:hypothetical protein